MENIETIKRKIYFYQILWVKNDDEKVQKDGKFIQTILDNIINQLKSKIRCFLEGQDEIEEDILYLERYENPNFNSDRLLYRISKIRNKNLPLIFDIKDKITSPLDLDKYQGLFEPSHFVVFEGKIIGAEYNHYGVRNIDSKLMKLINNYLRQNTIEDVKRIEIKPILKKEVYDIIEKFEEIRSIKISIATNYAKLLANEDPFSYGQIFSAAEMVDDMKLQLIFSIGKGKKDGNPIKFEKILKSVKKLLSRDDSRKNIDRLDIRGRLGDSESIETINILEELMLTEKRVPKLDNRTKAVDSESMYREIINSYLALKEELEEYIKPC